VSKEACKLCLNAALSQELISYIKNANYWVENVSDNGELEVIMDNFSLQHQPSLRTKLTVFYVIYNTVTVKTKLNSNLVW